MVAEASPVMSLIREGVTDVCRMGRNRSALETITGTVVPGVVAVTWTKCARVRETRALMLVSNSVLSFVARLLRPINKMLSGTKREC